MGTLAGIAFAYLHVDATPNSMSTSKNGATAPAPRASKSPFDTAIRTERVKTLLAKYREANDGAPSIAELQADIIAWLYADPNACIAFLKSRNALSLLTPGIINEACAYFGRRDPLTSLEVGIRIEDSPTRSAWIKSAFGSLAKQDPVKAFGALTVVPPVLQEELATNLAYVWGKHDGRQAVDAFLNSSFLRQPLNQIAIALQQWAIKAPDAAVGYALQCDAGKVGVSSTYLASYVMDEAAHNIEGIAAALLKRSSGPDSLRVNDLLTSISDKWAASDPEAAARWAAGLTTDIARARAISAVALGMARSKPELAMQLADQSLGPGAQQRIYAEAASFLAEQDGRGAFEWASDLDNPLLRDSVRRSVVSTWLRNDASAAVSYVMAGGRDRSGAQLLVASSNTMTADQLKLMVAKLDSSASSRVATFVQQLPPSPEVTKLLTALNQK
jgi:hypothetical protein